MKLVTHTFLTLDGVMQGPGGAEEDPSGGFGRGGWLVPFSDADMGVIVESWFARTEAILLGRNTYETMRAYWSQVTDPANSAATKLNHGRKYVVSNTLTRADWGDTTVLRGDVVGRSPTSRADGASCRCTAARLAQALHAAGLIDEYRLLTFPVTVGAREGAVHRQRAAQGVRPARIPRHQGWRGIPGTGPESLRGGRPERARWQGSRPVTD